MNILTLIITQANFDKIISGEKKIETREVRPTTEKKYVVINKEGAIVDVLVYDAIRFYVGYNKDRDSALVKVEGEQLIEIVDEKDQPIYYTHKNEKHQMIDIEYSLSDIIEKDIK